MRNIEQLISPLIESQFPAFYREEGKQFIAFVKAYYEWMEQPGNPLYQARNLNNYRDIDTTLDEFIIHFKEKYLRNIQFDTATNKKLLVKNSLDLYRSKGTERSIDLFFKLVYGADAEVKYPADNLFRLSDGIWTVPMYLEITESKYNVDYVGKQIIGSLSGATAFVEKYIRRRTDHGYVNLLYISDIVGNFNNAEVIGININNVPVYDSTKRAVLLGSVNRVEVIQRGASFNVGDIVSFASSAKGTGGSARVASTSDASGVVDFLFVNGGFGYTNTTSTAIVSERVISLNNVVTDPSSSKYFNLFENLVQPLINVSFTSSSDLNMEVGTTVYRYSSNVLVGQGTIIDITQSGGSGIATVSHTSGTFTNSYTYYTTSNVSSFYANTAENITVAGKVMGLPTSVLLNVSNKNGTYVVGQNVYQQNTSAIFAHGTITSINKDNLTINALSGAFKPTTSDGYLYAEGNTAVYSNVEQISLTAGVYEINNLIYTMSYSGSNNATISDTPYVYQYNSNNVMTAKGLVLTTTYTAGSGNISFVPVYGNFNSLKKVYTSSNTAQALIVPITVNLAGSAYSPSEFARVFTQTTNTSAIPLSTSFGAGAGFSVGNIGDVESIFINTDLINSNNVIAFDYGRKQLNIASNTGFSVADVVYQTVNKTAFNANSSVNATSGFIAVTNANTLFKIGDTIKYEVAAGNTVLNGMVSGDSYHVVDANTTGLKLSYAYRKLVTLNTTNYANFANNKVNQSGHYFYKPVYGTAFSIGSGLIQVQDVYNSFGNTGGTANTSSFANSNLILYSNTLVNTSITSISTYATVSQYSQPYKDLSIRSAAFGFPKNTQGNINATLYNCFAFQNFDIGTIGNITGINPGSQYNADPYILVQQPYISAQNKKDFVITITDATSNYVVGETVKQSDVTSNYYDLQVNKGVYSNTYNQVIESFNSQTSVNSTSDFISVVSNQYSNNTMLLYKVPNGNTAISGLTDNTAYYAVYANAGGFALSLTYNGANINLTAAGSSETHTFSTIPGYLPGDKVYQGSANAFVQSVYLDGSNQFVRISSNTAAFATNQILYSYTNPYVSGNVSAITSGSTITTAKGIVKSGSNTSVLYVKRMSFENNFVEGQTLTGSSSGATSTINTINIDQDVIYPIGLNAVVTANVVTANGQVTSLQVVDSGVGYTNSQVIEFLSSDEKRAGTMKLILDGNGKSQGYYRSSKGFISADMYIHDGDYYQEYSYEILSKLSFEKYSDMFKKVMHVAGTKFFGSVSIIEQAAIPVLISEIATGSEMSFNSQTGVNGSNETITFTYNPFANGDFVYYYTAAGNTVVTGLTNAHSYYVVNTAGYSVQLATSANGSAINITSASSPEVGHYLSKYVEEIY